MLWFSEDGLLLNVAQWKGHATWSAKSEKLFESLGCGYSHKNYISFGK